MPHAFTAAAADLEARGIPYVTATVVRVVPPASARPGDKAILTRDGLVHGWVGGSCAEPIVRAEVAAVLDAGEARLICITPTAEELAGRSGLVVHTMTCFSGGAIDVYLEPTLPSDQLVVFGRSPVALALCELGAFMGYRVQHVPEAEAMESLTAFEPSQTAAVVATHGNFDADALHHVLGVGACYVGLVCSPKRGAAMRQRLADDGVSDEQLAAIDAPAGVHLGARTPQEVAVSIMASVVAARRGRQVSSEPVDASATETVTEGAASGCCSG
ncbi:MAG: XdhC family protein [Myxococcales bacterium]|nr:XdhC family protein [Myxococcales bacterium]